MTIEAIAKSIETIGEKIANIQSAQEKTDKAVFDLAQKSAAPAPGAEQAKKTFARAAAEQIAERREELKATGRLVIELPNGAVMEKALKGAPTAGTIMTTNVPTHTQLPLGVEGNYAYTAAAALSVEQGAGDNIIHFSQAKTHGETGAAAVTPEGTALPLVQGVWTDISRTTVSLGGATVLTNQALSSVPTLETATGVILQNSLTRALDAFVTTGNGGDWKGLKNAPVFTSTYKDLVSAVLEAKNEGAKRGVEFDSIVISPNDWITILNAKDNYGRFLMDTYLENPSAKELRGLRVSLSETIAKPTLVSSPNTSLVVADAPSLVLALNGTDHIQQQITARLAGRFAVADYLDYSALQITLAA